MNLMRKPPIGQKVGSPKRTIRDANHMAKVARLPCCICQAFGEVQTSHTQVHHVICGRYGTLRASDRMTVPLCEGHHLGLRDTSKLAIHQGKETWAKKYGQDHEYVAATLDAVDHL